MTGTEFPWTLDGTGSVNESVGPLVGRVPSRSSPPRSPVRDLDAPESTFCP